MTALRAARLARTCAIAGGLFLLADRDLIFNGIDLITFLLGVASVALLIKSKGN